MVDLVLGVVSRERDASLEEDLLAQLEPCLGRQIWSRSSPLSTMAEAATTAMAPAAKDRARMGFMARVQSRSPTKL